MTISLESLAALVAVLGGVGSAAVVAMKVGQAQRRLDDLERRHGELAKETRDRLAASEHRTNGLERWQAAVDAKLAGIHDAVVEVKTILSRGRDHG